MHRWSEVQSSSHGKKRNQHRRKVARIAGNDVGSRRGLPPNLSVSFKWPFSYCANCLGFFSAGVRSTTSSHAPRTGFSQHIVFSRLIKRLLTWILAVLWNGLLTSGRRARLHYCGIIDERFAAWLTLNALLPYLLNFKPNMTTSLFECIDEILFTGQRTSVFIPGQILHLSSQLATWFEYSFNIPSIAIFLQYSSNCNIPSIFLQLQYSFNIPPIAIFLQYSFSCNIPSKFLQLQYSFNIPSIAIFLQYSSNCNIPSIFLQLQYSFNIPSVAIFLQYSFNCNIPPIAIFLLFSRHQRTIWSQGWRLFFPG